LTAYIKLNGRLTLDLAIKINVFKSYECVRLIVFLVAVRWDPIHKKNLDKNCGAPFGLDKMLVLVIKQPNWTLSDKNKEVCSI
jgi:hypothetical protein